MMFTQGDGVSLNELESVLRTYEGPPSPVDRPASHRTRPGGRALAMAAIAVAALAMAGIAIADGFGAFNGIRAAQHPQSGTDVLDPATAAYLRDLDCGEGFALKCGPMSPGLLLDSARLVGSLPDDRMLYVITNTHGDLCVVVEGPTPPLSCGSGLSQSRPTTVATAFDPGTSQRISMGVAIDGVTAVSFTAEGNEVTVPVKDNVWAYEGASSALDSITAHFENGSTVTLNQ